MLFWGILEVCSDLTVNFALWLMQFFSHLPTSHLARGQLRKKMHGTLLIYPKTGPEPVVMLKCFTVPGQLKV